MAKEAYSYGKRGLSTCYAVRTLPKGIPSLFLEKNNEQQDHHFASLRRLRCRGLRERGLFIWRKRLMHTAKEAYAYSRTGLCIQQKRPINIRTPEMPALWAARERPPRTPASPSSHRGPARPGWRCREALCLRMRRCGVWKPATHARPCAGCGVWRWCWL